VHATEPSQIPGYDYGTDNSAKSDVTEDEVRLLEKTTGWSEADAWLLRSHADLFRRHAEEMVASWRAVIGSQPHLAQWFLDSQGNPDEDYKARVKARFVQWVVDVVTRPRDRDWINYQQEIGLRHTPGKKNKTDNKQTPRVVPLRYLLAFIPVVLPVRQFFERELKDEGQLEALESAWVKALLLHLALWTKPYTLPEVW
jgi:hypothetical protein